MFESRLGLDFRVDFPHVVGMNKAVNQVSHFSREDIFIQTVVGHDAHGKS